jgi:MFS superfamily sulfate permease-like transporter
MRGGRSGSLWWIPATLRGYSASWLRADALAGLTLVAWFCRGQMATARLADMPAVAGLYAFIAGSRSSSLPRVITGVHPIVGSQFVGHRLPGPLAGLILSIAAVHA